MGNYSNKTWACPFYRRDERMCVHCEGGCVRFPDWKSRQEYIDRYCAHPSGWRGCSVAGNMEEYYWRTEEGHR